MSLLETLAVLVLETLLLSALTSALILSVDASRAAESTTRRIVARRHLEHLLDRTFAVAGGPATPATLVRADADLLVLHADLDGDGRIDPRSAERTALELRDATNDTRRLLHRIGRQAITVDADIPAASRLRYYAADGRATTSMSEIRVVAVATSGRALYFTIPIAL